MARCSASRSRTERVDDDRIVLQRGHVGGGRRWRCAENVLQDPLAANHGRGAGRVGGHGQNAPLAEQPAPHAVRRRARRAGTGCHRRAGFRNAGRAVRSGTCSPTSADRARCDPRAGRSRRRARSPRRNACRRLSSKSGNKRRSGVIDSRLRRCSHWSAKLLTRVRERGSASIRRTCCSSTSGLLSSPAICQVEQLVVRDAAPEEERQAGRELEIADAIGRPGRDAGRVLFDAEQELRVHQHGAQGHLDPRVEVSLRARLPVELHRLLEVRVGDRPPIRPAHQRGEDAPGTGFLLARPRRLADEDPAAAGRVPVPLGVDTGR